MLPIVRRPPSFQYAGHVRCAAKETFYFPLHHHPDITELLLIVRGSAHYVIDGRDYTAEEGAVVVFNAGVWHEEHNDDRRPFECRFIGLAEAQLDGLPEHHVIAPNQAPIVPMRSEKERMARLFQELADEYAAALPYSDAVAGQTLALIIALLYRSMHHALPAEAAASRPASRIVMQAQKYIAENYANGLTLDDIAESAYASKYYLCRLFQQELGISPIRAAIAYRMLVAKHYLTTTDLNMEDIAGKVGYASVTAFYNVFKRTTGASPGMYRRMAHGACWRETSRK